MLLYPSGKQNESFTIPDTVTLLGREAFSGAQLSEVIIPDSVISAEFNIFFECNNLHKITLPSGMTELSMCMFQCCGLTCITIPANIKTIGYCAFNQCSNLEEVTIENGVETIAAQAFFGCTKMTSIYIPPSVTIIRDEPFPGSTVIECIEGSYADTWALSNGYRCTYKECLKHEPILAETCIPNNGKYDGYIPAITCRICGTELCSERTIPASQVLVLPSSLSTIESDAFYGVSSSEVIIPESTELVKSGAFSNCVNLTLVWVSSDNTVFEENAFSDTILVIGCSAESKKIIQWAKENGFVWFKCDNR